MCRPSTSHSSPIFHPGDDLNLIDQTSREEDVADIAKKADTSAPLASILHRSTYNYCSDSLKRSKSCADIPGLVALSDTEDGSAVSRSSSTGSLVSEDSTLDLKQLEAKPKLSFNPQVLVQEFYRLPGEHETMWYSKGELRDFQNEAVSLARRYDCQNQNGLFYRPVKVMHSHPALGVPSDDGEEEDCIVASSPPEERVPTARLQNQVKRILILDTHDLSLKILSKAFRRAFPRATVSMAKRSQEAMDLCQMNSYDIVVVEERLSLFWFFSESGSAFLRTFLERPQIQERPPLCIGLSAHIDCDVDTLKESGADICWSKPPPALNQATVQGLLEELAVKRSD